MKLNIYNGNEIAKTYETENFHLKWRVTKKVIKMVDANTFKVLMNWEKAEMQDLIQLVQPLILSMDGLVEEIMLDIFPQMTIEELDDTDSVELAVCFIEAFKYIVRMFNAMNNGKNQ